MVVVLVAFYCLGLAGPAASTSCVESGHCEGLFYRGVGELLQVGNGDVYSVDVLERWWRASLLTEPVVQQSFVGTPASLPLHALYGFGDAARQSVVLGVLAAALVGLLSAWSGGLVFALSVLAGGAVAAGVVFGTPALFLGVGALMAYRGLKRGGSWWAGAGLALLGFRLEFCLLALLFLASKKKLGALAVGVVLTGGLWAVASVVWGGSVSMAWAQSLQHPPSTVDPGLGLIGLVPGVGGAWIPYWWIVYGVLGALAVQRCQSMTPAQGVAFLLALSLLVAPQVDLADYILLTPFFLAFFPRPERPGLVFGGACYALSLVGLAVLLPLAVLLMMSFGQQNLEQELL